MIRPRYLWALAAGAAVATASAADFPLTFRTIPAKDVMAFPGGSGVYGMLQLSKPAAIKKEPKAVSAHALYGQCRESRAGAAFLYRLDESKGDGKGYDKLIVDMNQNGDLTDDPVVSRVVPASDRGTTAPEQVLFGPIAAPEGTKIAGGQPVYYAQTYLYNTALLRSTASTPRVTSMIGQLRLKAGWYVEAMANLRGIRQKMGVYDGNSNLRLGDVPVPQIITNRSGKSWYFTAGDSLLQDADGSGAFETDFAQTESSSFSPLVYFGSQAYKLTLTADNTSLRLEPWAEALAEVVLEPRGDQVRTVTLAWEQPDAQWQLIRAGPADGKIQVPPGNYRLYACELIGKAALRDQVMVSATRRAMQDPVRIAAGQANSLRCGAPLEVKVTATKANPRLTLLRARAESAAPKQDAEFNLRISASVAGAGGEVYSTFRKGEKFRLEPSKPTFTITDAKGSKIKDGNLEFG